MKKLITLALAVLMIAATATTTAFAADINQDTFDPKTSDTAVEFSVDPAYTVTIPATVELDKTETDGTVTYEKDMDITASAGVRLLEGQNIQVTMNGDFQLDTDAGATYKLPYAVKVGDAGSEIVNGGVVATFGTSKGAQKSTLHFAADDPEYAGDYSDTVTFTIAIVKA